MHSYKQRTIPSGTIPSGTIRMACGALFAVLFMAMPSAAVVADDNLRSDLFPNFSLPGQLGDLSPTAESPKPVEWRAVAIPTGAGTVSLQITAALSSDWHLYSTTQPAGGPLPTKFEIVEGGKSTEKFTPDRQPTQTKSEDWPGLTVEEHNGTVTWAAPVQLDGPTTDTLRVKVKGLTCADGRCMPTSETLVVQLGAAPEITVAEPVWFRDEDYAVRWSASVETGDGSSPMLRFTAEPDPGYHIYTAATDDSDSSTNFVVIDKTGLQVGAPKTEAAVIEKELLPTMPMLRYHESSVTWELPLADGGSATAGEHSIRGKIAYMACTDTSCLRPKAIEFLANVPVAADGSITAGISMPIGLTAAKPGDALDQAADIDWVDDIALITTESATPSEQPDGAPIAASSAGTGSSGGGNSGGGGPVDPVVVKTTVALTLPWLLLLGFAGGIILNVMPCVLPVIGLKVMSFINQAGENRSRVLTLNAAYIAGIYVVFGLLATLAVAFGLGWGQQFQNFGFRIGATVGIFAFALSYLGVWEIPTPAIISTAAVGEAKREGLAGAFSKGAFATLLATPCSAPLLGSVFASLIGAPATTVYLVFFAIAAGMALPFAVIGFIPKAATYLPKPGPWMEKFKEVMAFTLLGAVAFFFSQFADDQKLPAFIMLIGVWFGCWIIGQVPAYKPIGQRMFATLSGVAVAVAIGLFAFQYIGAPSILKWRPYDSVELAKMQREGKTVLVDFTAEWCMNCKLNERWAIDTENVRSIVDRLNVVTVKADWTDEGPEVTKKLRELNSNSIPVLAIYPAGDPDHPIVLRDLVKEWQVIEALESAGPSQTRVAIR